MKRESDTGENKVTIELTRYFKYEKLFDHETEYEFYKILRDEILGKRFVAMVQVPVSSLVGVRRRKELGFKAHFSKIARKRVDFLICRIEDLSPLLVIELDGSTHALAKRKERDEFLDDVFAAVGLPILHVPVQSSYDKQAIAMQIASALGLVKRQ